MRITCTVDFGEDLEQNFGPCSRHMMLKAVWGFWRCSNTPWLAGIRAARGKLLVFVGMTWVSLL